MIVKKKLGKQLEIFQWDMLAPEVVNSLKQKYLWEMPCNELPMSQRKNFWQKSDGRLSDFFFNLSSHLGSLGFSGLQM